MVGYNGSKVKRSKKRKPLSDEDISSIVSSLVEDAEDYVDTHLAPQREEATRYFNGEPLGNEEEGRSQIVMTEVRDIVLAMMPSLLRVFTSPENAVEFTPRRADAVAGAEQATDYINYLFSVENNGARILYDAFEDALVRKTGIFKWYTVTDEKVTEEPYDGIGEDELINIENDPELEIEDLVELLPAGFDAVDPMTGQPIMSPAIYNVKAKRTVVTKKFVVEAIPPEEFLISRDARDEDHAGLIGHRKDELVSKLVAMGYDQDELMEHGEPKAALEINGEVTARNPALAGRTDVEVGNLDPSLCTVRYYETLVWMDEDGDGIAELWKVCGIGQNGKHVLHKEIVEDVNFAILCPQPIPHSAIGKSMADLCMDLQNITTNVVRSTLDSLSQSIFPRTGVVEDQVNMDDVLNTEMGGIIRMRTPGAVVPLSEPFVGQQALPVLSYLSEVKAGRTGVSRATQGLDADVLQSTTKAAVTATVSAAEARLEMIARIFADTGIKRLFRGFLRMVIRNQDQARVVRLRGKWVEVTPAQWDIDMDVVVNVGIGEGSKEEKISILAGIAAKQEQAMQLLGPDNPLVSLTEYRATLGKALELAGFKDTETYWKQVTPEAIQAMLDKQAASQPQDPAVALAQAEEKKVMADIEINRAKMTLDELKARWADDRERDRVEIDAFLRAKELELKYGTQMDMAAMQHVLDRQRQMADIAMQIADKTAQSEMQGEAQMHQQGLADRQQAHTEAQAAQAAAAAAQGSMNVQ